jgi:hypothetical protein
MKRAMLVLLLLITGPWLAAADPSPLSFTLPVKCEVGGSCLIQKLVDHDPGPGRQDYRCGTLTTDGHDGVDIRLRTMEDMRADYAVVASAAGQVLRIRDGEPDISVRARANVAGRDAGNGVVIDHGNGWQTQYSHLRQGSVNVRSGQRVAAGEQIGIIGMSGNSEFPHLHFTVRYNDKVVDPFVGAGPVAPCNANARTSGLWTPPVASALSYQPTAIITAGLASNVPPKAVADRITLPGLEGPQAPILMWVDIIGAKAGDVQAFTITCPAGLKVHAQETILTTGGLSWFAFSGKRAPASGWPKGRYVGKYTLRRDGMTVAQTEVANLIR